MDAPATQPADRYINRELSLLAFNERVLAQSADESVPLLERLRFLCISCTNQDEFFEVRVAGLKQLVEIGASTGGSGFGSVTIWLLLIWFGGVVIVAAVLTAGSIRLLHLVNRTEPLADDRWTALAESSDGALQILNWQLDTIEVKALDPALAPAA